MIVGYFKANDLRTRVRVSSPPPNQRRFKMKEDKFNKFNEDLKKEPTPIPTERVHELMKKHGLGGILCEGRK